MEACASEAATILATRTPAETAEETNSHGVTIGGSFLRLAVKRWVLPPRENVGKLDGSPYRYTHKLWGQL